MNYIPPNYQSKSPHKHSRSHTRPQTQQPQHHHQKITLTSSQEEMKRQCGIMMNIVRPDDTKNIFKYMSDNDEVVDLTPEMSYCINGTVYRKRFYDPGPKKSSKTKCQISVVNESAIKAARALHSKNCEDICIMNFASPMKPGGSYDHGSLSQESSIVSQTLLFGSICSRTAIPFYDNKSTKNFHKFSKKVYKKPQAKRAKSDDDDYSDDDSSGNQSPQKFQKSHSKSSYHSKSSHYSKNTRYSKSSYHSKSSILLSDNGLIYSPKVPVIADGEAGTSSIPNANKGKKKEKKFILFDKEDVFYVDVISVSPVNKAMLMKDKKSCNEKQIKKLMETKIKNTICMAAMRDQYLILGAFGCGSFGNDPKDVAKIFKKVLIREKYSNYFKGIEFAIAGNKQSYDAFNKVFNKDKEKDKKSSDESDDDEYEENLDERNKRVNEYSDDDYNNNYDDEEEEEESAKNKKKKNSDAKNKNKNKNRDNDDDDNVEESNSDNNNNNNNTSE